MLYIVILVNISKARSISYRVCSSNPLALKLTMSANNVGSFNIYSCSFCCFCYKEKCLPKPLRNYVSNNYSMVYSLLIVYFSVLCIFLYFLFVCIFFFSGLPCICSKSDKCNKCFRDIKECEKHTIHIIF